MGAGGCVGVCVCVSVGLAAVMKETLAGLLQLAALEGFLCRGDARASRHQYS